MKGGAALLEVAWPAKAWWFMFATKGRETLQSKIIIMLWASTTAMLKDLGHFQCQSAYEVSMLGPDVIISVPENQGFPYTAKDDSYLHFTSDPT